MFPNSTSFFGKIYNFTKIVLFLEYIVIFYVFTNIVSKSVIPSNIESVPSISESLPVCIESLPSNANQPSSESDQFVSTEDYRRYSTRNKKPPDRLDYDYLGD